MQPEPTVESNRLMQVHMATVAEFTLTDQYPYDHRSPVRWIVSHLKQSRWLWIGFLISLSCSSLLSLGIPVSMGRAVDAVLGGSGNPQRALIRISLVLLGVVSAQVVADILTSFSTKVIARRFERDAREELFTSLLGKSQTFHNRQRVGDLMARTTNDIHQLGLMMSPGIDSVIGSLVTMVIPVIFIAFLDVRLLAVPALFVVGFMVLVRVYMHWLDPVSKRMRDQFGILNAELNESVRGVEVIKATGQEAQERGKFSRNARLYRDYTVAQGVVQAKYLPPLVLAVAIAFAMLHGVYLVQEGELTVGGLITYLGLVGQLWFATSLSSFSLSLVQLGTVSAGRILKLMEEKTELDQNLGGKIAQMKGELVFDEVTFSYGGEPVLTHISFHAKPGETIAIVGETGSGKSTLTKLVNRIYDIDSGTITIDGTDVREWNLDSLRSQISTIEQDITLFSRSVAENIGFSLGQDTDRAEIVRAAKDAQAHEFIVALDKGYDTVIGERGVTLSGGQRQRLAIARALLTSPRVLILDDSTSAIDSATEDEIQQAIRRVLEDRTTLLITHRLSQIRWADKVLLIRGGQLVDQGTHEELLKRSRLYRRIFAHYDETDLEVELEPAGSPKP